MGTIKQTTAGMKHEKRDPKPTCKSLHFSPHKEDIILDYFHNVLELSFCFHWMLIASNCFKRNLFRWILMLLGTYLGLKG